MCFSASSLRSAAAGTDPPAQPQFGVSHIRTRRASERASERGSEGRDRRSRRRQRRSTPRRAQCGQAKPAAMRGNRVARARLQRLPTGNAAATKESASTRQPAAPTSRH
jgi:hypothetical protein